MYSAIFCVMKNNYLSVGRELNIKFHHIRTHIYGPGKRSKCVFRIVG